MFTIPKNSIHATEKGSISMIPPSYVSDYMFEIYCLEGDLFDDIERFHTEEEAMERVNNLLN